MPIETNIWDEEAYSNKLENIVDSSDMILHFTFSYPAKGSLSYHLCVEYFSQFSFNSEMYTISAAVLKQLLIMYSYLNQMRIGKNIRHNDDRINSQALVRGMKAT